MRKFSVGKKSSNSRRMSVYSNLTHKRKTKKDAASRRRAEYLATLPKHPVKRALYRLHPKRVAGYWFSKAGALALLKVGAVVLLAGVLFTGGLFAYYRKDVDQIRPSEIAKRVQTTVTKYYDRNGQLLYEDKGDGNYKLVVESDQISPLLKEATIAIEDQDFYDHHGVSPTGIVRATVSNARGNSTQGGSTLTQQLVKQVFFADEASDRGFGGIPRKIKEIILAIEVERMYDKNDILALYLNESPYGGRRNGAESAAQTYFGKPALELNLPESAMLAAIPNQPGLYDPYNEAGHTALITRQHNVLDKMVSQNFITRQEADDAKAYAILDTIQPLVTDGADISAPHFVLSVRSQLERELGKATVGQGGLSVTTTLDKRIQDKLQEQVGAFFASGTPESFGISNAAATVEDTATGQIVAMVGSRDYSYTGFGQTNAAESFIQPGSTVKPFVFAELFKDKGSNQTNFGSGSILRDENIDSIYGAPLQNHDGRFMGNINIRQGLALSRNVPAVKAMEITGVEQSIKTIRDAGATNYCTQEEAAGVGLSAAIGACTVKQTQMVNAYATLARNGTYRPTSTVLEVKNSQGDTLKKWKEESKQVLDPQIAYIISDILGDQAASTPLHGSNALTVPGVRTASKTGTSDINKKPKDLWLMTYSPALSMGVWLGNNDTRNISSSNSAMGNRIVRPVLEFAHKEVYAPEGKWNSNAWFDRPEGIQQQGKELYPSWWNRRQGQSNAKLTFDRVSKKLATDCTPEAARIEIDVTKSTDPVTKREVFTNTNGYDAANRDELHKCDDAKPSIGSIAVSNRGNEYTIRATVQQGTHGLETIDILVDGESVKSSSISGSGVQTATYTASSPGTKNITVNIRDSAYYTASGSSTLTVSSSSTENSSNSGRGNNRNDD
ncbi:penicillin-binding protein [Candidatus Saccharibacteria bacterium]|nr:penicillin-binding protein [Candidatus Saccharibacteria bacterium]